MRKLSGKYKRSGTPTFPGIYDLKKVWNPPWFQGNLKIKNYFEGWYIKVVSRNGSHSWAFIPGISLHKGDRHAFVQAINGKTGKTWYFRYPLEAFSFSKNNFEAAIGNNYFSAEGIKLDLSSDKGSFKGELEFLEQVHFPVSLITPGIMGWYRYVPFMECYHGVVSMDHQIKGSLVINETACDFSEGKGYIEKDWGASMPQSWIWMQTNHFETPKTSLMLSVATIPWVRKKFTGFLGFFLHKGKLYHFATYSHARINQIEHNDDHLDLSLNGRGFSLKIQGKKGAKGSLKAPMLGNMGRVIHESLDSIIDVELINQNGERIFKGQGKNAGLEIVGDASSLIPK